MARRDGAPGPMARMARLLLLLTRRNAAGEAVPCSYPELLAELRLPEGGELTLRRMFAEVAAGGWVVHQQGAKPRHAWAERPERALVV